MGSLYGGPDQAPDGAVAAVVDSDGTFTAWSGEAELLLGRPAGEVVGSRVGALLAHAGDWQVLLADGGGKVRLLDGSGRPVEAYLGITDLGSPLAEGGRWLVLIHRAAAVENLRVDEALVRALLKESRPGLIVYDMELTIRRAAASLGDVTGRRLPDIYDPRDAAALEERLREVARTGTAMIGWEHSMRRSGAPGGRTALSFSAFRMTAKDGRPIGVASVCRDVTELHRSRLGMDLLHRAVTAAAAPLDATRTAEALVDVLVPDFASWAAVDLVEEVFEGAEMPGPDEPWPTRQRQAAGAQAPGRAGVDPGRRGRAIGRAPDTPRMRRLRGGEAFLLNDLPLPDHDVGVRARHLRAVFPPDARSAIVAPLAGGEGLLGVLSLSRAESEAPFDEEDLALITELTPSAALNISNGWQFAREHRAVLTLQRSLLPPSRDRTAAAEVAGTYVSAAAETGVGGDWYDTVPLSSFRSAFVVGDVVGRGLRAAATMGRLRTAVQSFADLDLDPGELLARLDDLVSRQSAEREATTGGGPEDTAGATCLYAVYDPVSRLCNLASAGHPPPALVRPDGSVSFVDLDPGPPLGVGGMPFETAEFTVEPGSVLAFYTDGLVTQGGRDIEDGMRALLRRLGEAQRPDVPLRELGRDVAALLPARPTDDAALLLARTREVTPVDTTFWELPADDRAPAEARRLAAGQLSAWGADDLAFYVEIVISELVTNAVRYGGGPIGLRLIRGDVLVCEVTDTSNTQPRMRRAQSTDEGGRGLFIVAQLVRRWGSRYGRSGKTIWAELLLPPAGAAT
ncbi:Serine phosphatase RsbU, regulator of sigma subunit [Actinacidiphila yanglinensis]|uniref:Serine phosphatase RsbU, regulator of sigma subunit n=1 Tax=Actinacidiphila yanglinensis TaxID=310779 RepID=A0A1H6DHF3_9ACTN|nr:SpoIIE family protein phosphatase [Actinacidiphila yanglinensis]SEG84572.1 Serine phosphatase RsbU, regulator of sigma subunit [Actinacidiphila yanglinensis]